jgi:uncharacterized protein (DUF2147 family)
LLLIGHRAEIGIADFMRSTLVMWLLFSTPLLSAQTSSPLTPVGRWKTVDDATNRVKSIVVIWEENGKLNGRIERLIEPDPQYPDPRCVRCAGEFKDRPVIGLRILWDLRKDGERWIGGKVLDPNNGKTYKCFVVIEDGGKRLRVRGFIGSSFVGRTQYWLREGE